MALAAAKSTKSAPALVSMAPDSFTSGLFDDQDGEITDCQSTVFDWNGQVPADTPAFAVEITDVNGGQHTQYYSLGKAEDWEPSEDGRGFVPKSGKSGINKTSNLGMLIESLVENGFPVESLASGDLKAAMTGLKAHWIIKKTERVGLVRQGKNADRPTGVLIVNKIHALPGTKASTTTKAAAGGKANGAAAAAPKGKPAAGDEFDAVDEILVPAVLEALADGELEKKQLVKIANAAFNTPENKGLRNAAIGRANQPAFMAKLEESGVTVDGGKLSL